MKIGIVSPFSMEKEPLAHYTISLLSYLKEYGLELYLFSKRIPKSLSPEIQVFESFYSPKAPFHALLEDISKEGPFDVIEIHFSFFHFPCVLRTLEILRGIKKKAKSLIISLQEVIHPRYDEYMEKFQRKLAEVSDLLLVHHSAQKVELLSSGIPEEKIRTVEMGSDNYPRSTRPKRIFLGIDWRNLKLVSFYGPFSRESNLLDILKGVEKARKERKDIFLLISGYLPRSLDLAYFEKIRAECEKVRWAKVLYRPPEIWEVHEIYAISSAVLLPFTDPPGIIKACPFLHLEMYSGTPPIFPRELRFFEISEPLKDLSYSSGSISEMAEAILRGVEKKKPIPFLRRYSKKTSWEKVARKRLEIYEELGSEGQI